jgi:hypothetical protein
LSRLALRSWSGRSSLWRVEGRAREGRRRYGPPDAAIACLMLLPGLVTYAVFLVTAACGVVTAPGSDLLPAR